MAVPAFGGKLRYHRLRVLKTVGVAVVLSALGVLAVVHPATAAPTGTPTLSATSTTNLRDQVITISWTGFKPTKANRDFAVTLYQCTGNPQALTDCDTDPPYPAIQNGNAVNNITTQPDGTGQANMQIRTDDILPSLGCNQATPCSVIAVIVGAFKSVQSAPQLSLSFGASPNDCPSVSQYAVRAEGSSPAARAVGSWISGACALTPPFVANYIELSSPRGRADFLEGLVDTGVTSMPATTAEVAAAANPPPFSYVPLAGDPLVVAFNIWDQKTLTPITNMNLSPRLVAILLTNSQNDNGTTFFNDPEFKKDNPGHAWPTGQMAPPLVRAEQNDDTLLMTTWLAQDPAVQTFLAGQDPDMPINPSWLNVPWPTSLFDARSRDTTYLPRNGTSVNITNLFYDVAPNGTLLSRTGSSANGLAAVTDLASAEAYGMPVAALENASGDFVAPDAAGLTAAYQDMTTNSDGVTRSADPSTTDAAAYPLPEIDYAMVPTGGITPQLGRNLVTFLNYITTTGQTAGVLPAGYYPLTPDLLQQAATNIALIPAPALGRKLHFDAGPLETTTPVATTGSTTTTTGSSETPPAAAPGSSTRTSASSRRTSVSATKQTTAAAPSASQLPLAPVSSPNLRERPSVALSASPPLPNPSTNTPSSPPRSTFQAVTRLFGGGGGQFVLPILLLLALGAAIGGPVLLSDRWRPLLESLRR